MATAAIASNFRLAFLDSDVFEEVGPVNLAGKLGKFDFHFGLDGYIPQIDHKITQVPLPHLGINHGPREVDMVLRGGRIAEELWQEELQVMVDERGPRSMKKGLKRGEELRELISLHDTDMAKVPIKPGHHVFQHGAKMNKNSVADQAKYRNPTGPKIRDNVEFGGTTGTASQWATRFSKTAIAYAIAMKGKVHFHLDGLGSVGKIILKEGDWSHNVTCRELRYVFRNWQHVHQQVVFYNGFQFEPASGPPRAVVWRAQLRPGLFSCCEGV